MRVSSASISAHDDMEWRMAMKKKRFLTWKLLVVLCLALMLSGCAGKEYTVSFDGNLSAEQTVRSGKKVEEPQAPAQEGRLFLGWFKDAGLTEAWDFANDKVEDDLTLYPAWELDSGDEIAYPSGDKDFSALRTPGSQEAEYDYQLFFLPAIDGVSQPYVGDTMPYYEDGTYYIYYLKEAGDSYNHSVYLATTQDFVTYTEVDEVVLEANRGGGQDGWIGTGSVVKVGDKYYFFYTGHSDAADLEFKETIMLAVGDTPTSFEKVAGWEITPPSSLGQKNDFRDPQGYYDPETGTIVLTVTASQSGVARILKYTLSADLEEVTYDGIIFTNEVGSFWNLECSDTFKMGDTWYITYSAQDDTLWYASSETPYGPYSPAQRLEGKLFYAAKHVEKDGKVYMVGWARRSESVSSTQDVAGWAGNLIVQQVKQNADGSLFLAPVDEIVEQFTVRRALAADASHVYLDAGSLYSYEDAFTCYERFMLKGEFTFTGTGSFGLSFDYNGRNEKNKLIILNPAENKLQFAFNEGSTLIAEKEVTLQPGQTYAFTYIQEGSVGTFYIDGMAALTTRIYGASGKTIRLFAENNAVLFTSLKEYTMPEE